MLKIGDFSKLSRCSVRMLRHYDEIGLLKPAEIDRFTNEAIAAVATWIEANGCESDGPMFNIYHVSPHETQNPDEFVTEVCFQVRKKA